MPYQHPYCVRLFLLGLILTIAACEGNIETNIETRSNANTYIPDDNTDIPGDDTSDQEDNPIDIAQPANFRTTATRSTSVSLAWDVVEEAGYYQLHRDEIPIAVPLAAQTSLTDRGLVAGESYSYALAACKSGTYDCSSQTRLSVTLPKRLNDTGLTRGGDYPAGNRNGNDCDGTDDTGANLPSQDCHHGRDATHNDDSDGHAGFSFTKLDSNGNELPAGATRWNCVRDNVTGLIWEVKQDKNDRAGDSLHDADDSYTWYSTDFTNNHGRVGYVNRRGDICYGYDVNDSATFCNTQAFVARVNAQGLCGLNNWRLPIRDELRGIVSNNHANPAIDTNYFPNTLPDDYYLSTPNAHNTNYASGVYFSFGSAFYAERFSGQWARLVSGVKPATGATATAASGQTVVPNILNYWPDSRYREHNDGTATDTQTGLMWKVCSQGQTWSNGACSGDASGMSWQAALEAGENESYAGYDDWRLPNAKELISLAALDRYTPAINANVFPNTASRLYWTSSPSITDNRRSRYVSFDSGHENFLYRFIDYRVRLVRGGQ